MQPPSNEAIGARLRKARVKAGVSQSALGALLGVTFQSVAKYEKGTSAMSALQVIRAARALGCSPADLLPAGKGPRAKPSRVTGPGRRVG